MGPPAQSSELDVPRRRGEQSRARVKTCMRLEGKVALVTGATRGIGRTVGGVFAREGAKVVLAGRTAEAGAQLESEIRTAGGAAVYVQTDIGNEADVVRAVRTAVDRFGSLSTLVNNAAATHLSGLPDRGDAG